MRKININYVEKMLLTKEPLGLLSSRKNRFKVYFPSELNPKNDLIVVIAIDSDDKIIGVTTYEDPITKREGVK